MHSNQTFINDGFLFFHHGYKSFASSYLLNLVQTTVQTKFYLQRIKNYVYLFTHACFFIFFYHFSFSFLCLFLEKDENKRRSSKSPGIKCVVVGDGTAGKTNLIQSYLLDSYVHDSSYIPTAFDKYNGEHIDVLFYLKI